MQYTYEIEVQDHKDLQWRRLHTTTNWDEALIEIQQVTTPKRIAATNNLTKMVQHLYNEDDIEAWQTALERSVWKDKASTKEFVAPKKDHINPSHYQAYMAITGKCKLDDGYYEEDLQWLEAAQYRPHWRDPEKFKAAVLLQADKYLSRLGGKDEAVQELKKGIWYLRFLTAYIANGNKPIRVKDIPQLLGEK